MKFLAVLLVVALAVVVSGRAQSKPVKANLPQDLGCSFCTLIVGEVEKAVAANQTEGQIIRALDQTCNALGPFSVACQSFVNNSVSAIIQFLEQDYNATEICDALGLCGNHTTSAAAAQQSTGSTASSSASSSSSSSSASSGSSSAGGAVHDDANLKPIGKPTYEIPRRHANNQRRGARRDRNH